MITITINIETILGGDGTSVAAAIFIFGTDRFRRSVRGRFRGPMCGMGVCFECRVTIDGVSLQRSCNILAADGMEVLTDG